MKFYLLLFTILFSTFNLLSQTQFEPGYVIQTNGKKLQCFIKNEDWKGSPSSFNYKLDENGEVKTGNVSSISEFGSSDNFKYIAASVSMEQTSNKVNFLTHDRNPVLKEETLFLKVLVEGSASLYYTIKNGDNRFFYKINNGEIQPLIYKRYLTKGNKMGENNRYKQQLATDFVCSNLKNIDFEKLEYKKSSLIKRFEEYNTCNNTQSIVYEKNDFQYGFNLTLRPGLTFGSAFVKRSGEEQIDFDKNTSLRIGLEVEYILPFNNGKWGLFVEPTYRTYNGEKQRLINEDFPTMRDTTLITVKYNSIEMHIGLRYYMFLNEDSAIFLNGAVVLDVSTLDSEISSSKESTYNFEFKSETTTAFGAGFKFKNKYSIEARYMLSKKIINYVNASASYQSFSLIAGYNFL
ncbi:hypothetical protein EI546_15650 [Aequorivita sp. H23M31]|uniref:tRNA modification GTPase n=1 Tax=Aequorivita ciconiae TaxID=2494375 RepID=A0A410G6Y4_9FLAO|nr:hypothetical protein [Aequorivita sp. H23M31]QAA83059.1 hypothetical protein EI546_15650 [Aequorivita sp. H23M31]